MRGSELAEAVASAVDRIVSAREGTGALDRAIEVIVDTIGRFGGKDATSYLEAYRAEMVMRDIPEDRRLAGFPRVAMSGIDSEVLEARCRVVTCVRGEGRNHGGLGLRRRGEGIRHEKGASLKKKKNE